MFQSEDAAVLRAVAAITEVQGSKAPHLKELAAKVFAMADKISEENKSCETQSSVSG